MIALVLLTQVALPLVLLAWLALFPAGSQLGWLMQVAGIAAFLFALARVAQWAVPVWWLPWIYAGVLLAIVLWQVPVLAARPLWPSGRAAGWH